MGEIQDIVYIVALGQHEQIAVFGFPEPGDKLLSGFRQVLQCKGIRKFAAIKHYRFLRILKPFSNLLFDVAILHAGGNERNCSPIGEFQVTPVTLVKTTVGC